MSLKYEILSLLEKLGEATTKEISKQLNIDVSVVKVYMNRLHKAGLVERRKAGMEYVYRLASPSPTPLPPPTTSSTPTSNRVNMKVNNRVNMKVNIGESLYNVNSNRVNMKVNIPVNMKVNNRVNIAKSEVNNKYNVNLDSSLYILFYIKDELKKLIEQIELYVNRHVNSDVNWHVNPNVNSDVNPRVVVEEEVEGVRPLSPPAGSGVGREWAYTLVALLFTKKLAQYLLAQNSDPLSVAILEKLLVHYITTSNKFVVFNDYRELIEYFNLNVNDIIKSKRTINKAITKLTSVGLIYFIKISNAIKIGLKKRALKMLLT